MSTRVQYLNDIKLAHFYDKRKEAVLLTCGFGEKTVKSNGINLHWKLHSEITSKQTVKSCLRWNTIS